MPKKFKTLSHQILVKNIFLNLGNLILSTEDNIRQRNRNRAVGTRLDIVHNDGIIPTLDIREEVLTVTNCCTMSYVCLQTQYREQ